MSDPNTPIKSPPTSNDFETAVTQILKYEGGYVNDPSDPGGETNFGISKRSYPTLDIANLTVDDAKAIYKRDYWDACDCSTVAWPLSFVVFDCAVNQGVGAAKALLAATTNAVHYQYLRFLRYTKSPVYPKYGTGWVSRLFQGLEFSLSAEGGT